MTMLRCTLLLILLGACRPTEVPEEPETHEHEDHGTVRIGAAALARAGVATSSVARRRLTRRIDIPAELGFDPDRVVHVAALVDGQVAEARVSVGDRVKKGAVLASLRSVTLGETRAALAEARAELEVMEARFRRQKQLTEEGIGARRELDEARGELATARARVGGLESQTQVYGRGGSRAQTFLRSPIEGEVIQRHATVGEVVGPKRSLFVVGDTREVWVTGQVYARDIEHVSVGADARFVADDGAAPPASGTLDWVSPVLEASTRTLPVRMVLPNPEGRLRPGLFGHLLLEEARPRVVLRSSAVFEHEGRSKVFVPLDEPGAFEARVVELGIEDGAWVELLGGLEPGESYVSDQVFTLVSVLRADELGEGHAH